MLDTLDGILREKLPTAIRVEVHGLGFKIAIPKIDYDLLPPTGQKVFLYTILFLKETLFELYGFLQSAKRDLFFQLIQISGIGPKTAFHILSSLSLEKFIQTVGAKDAAALARIPGIGKKTAERVILEMKDYAPASVFPSQVQDALSALMRLGYSKNKAEQALEKSLKENQDLGLEELITTSLKHLS